MEIISIGGASRSGSTLVAFLLGRLDDSFVAGELRYVWSRGFRQNQLCGCGVPFRNCPFWRAVMAEAYGSMERVPVRELEELHRSVTQIWHLPELVSPLRTPKRDRAIRRYVDHLEGLCTAIGRVSGARMIVDSSKLPTYCYLLSRMPGARVRLIHLVRDSRAVAFSFLRRKSKPEVHWRAEYMRRMSPVDSALDWNVLNLGMDLLPARGLDCARLRYEDVVEDPASSLRRAVRRDPGVPGDAVVELGTNHTVAGNPVRFSSGHVRIRADREWRERMRPQDRALVSALTWPLLLRYGYLTAADGSAPTSAPVAREREPART